MTKHTEQMAVWEREFGRAYTDRNTLSVAELDALYTRDFGITRMAMNEEFLSGLDRNIKILEVGSNTGNQLLALQEMGFSRLYGVELQPYAVEQSKKRTQHINIIQGSAFDVPFKDGFFDLVFTSGVLIHIAPADIATALHEIHRCSNRFIWGMEYFSERQEDVPYRGHEHLLWKTDFARLYLEAFEDLRMVKQRVYERSGTENRDAMFLLERSR